MLLALVIFNAASFLAYGLGCVFSQRMRGEFIRYRLSRFRTLVGVLQIMGAIGQVTGLWLAWAGLLSAIGLVVLMLLGVTVRIIIKDSVLQTLPAGLYMLLNAVLCYLFAQLI